MKRLTPFVVLFLTLSGYGQDGYKDTLNQYIADYIKNHEVVTGDNKKFLRFYPVNEAYKITASFEKANNSQWFSMETSGKVKKTFRVYGILHFEIQQAPVKLHVYQSQNLMTIEKLQDYLFIPFTDLSSGEETYTAGRYIDIRVGDITGNKLVLDFNKAYNPYCAYVDGKYNCPIPPKENHLPVRIEAGEKNFLQAH